MSKRISEDYLGCYRFEFDTAYDIDRYILTHGSWEYELLQFIEYFLRPGDVCVDVGANAGYLTFAMAKHVGKQGRVHAFEPSPTTYPRLISNIALNPGLDSIIHCHKLALSDSPGVLSVFQSGGFGNAYVAAERNPKLWNRPEHASEEVPVATMDEHLSGEALRFIKIDVEGMELEVLRGASQLITANKPVIVYETLIDCFESEKLAECQQLLESWGYIILGLGLEGKLVRVTYPKYTENTFAIHGSEVTQFADLLRDAAKYKLEYEQTELGADFARLSDFIVVAVEKDHPQVLVNDRNGKSHIVDAKIDAGKMVFKYPDCHSQTEQCVFLEFEDQGLVEARGMAGDSQSMAAVRGHRVAGSLPRL